jgi:hypothetical protein
LFELFCIWLGPLFASAGDMDVSHRLAVAVLGVFLLALTLLIVARQTPRNDRADQFLGVLAVLFAFGGLLALGGALLRGGLVTMNRDSRFIGGSGAGIEHQLPPAVDGQNADEPPSCDDGSELLFGVRPVPVDDPTAPPAPGSAPPTAAAATRVLPRCVPHPPLLILPRLVAGGDRFGVQATAPGASLRSHHFLRASINFATLSSCFHLHEASFAFARSHSVKRGMENEAKLYCAQSSVENAASCELPDRGDGATTANTQLGSQATPMAIAATPAATAPPTTNTSSDSSPQLMPAIQATTDAEVHHPHPVKVAAKKTLVNLPHSSPTPAISAASSRIVSPPPQFLIDRRRGKLALWPNRSR